MYQFCADPVYANRLIGVKKSSDLQQGRMAHFPIAVPEFLFTLLIKELWCFHGQLFIGWY